MLLDVRRSLAVAESATSVLNDVHGLDDSILLLHLFLVALIHSYFDDKFFSRGMAGLLTSIGFGWI